MSNHVGRYKLLGFMSDAWECSCGWESPAYWDGAEYAEADWKRHAQGIEAPSGGETTKIGSTEGESPVARQSDAPNNHITDPNP